MASLLGMPVEVQWQIFHRLLHAHAENENSESRPYGDTWESTLVHHTALGNLSGTCKHLNATTAPLLYQRVNVSICYPATFILVLRHFSRFPKHAAFARDLTIDSDYTCSPCSKSQRYFLVQEAYRLGLDLSFKGNGRWPQFGSLLIDVALCHLSAIQKLKLILPLITSSNEEWCPVSPNEANPFRSVEFEYASRLPPSFVLCSLQRPPEGPAAVEGDYPQLGPRL
ncbi:predicted protein [Chaetomium globosum CBS 148.51]|uniref:Uncharacterized protein n=1 Tax=Chaetomium globosum (strain ATCC 6205 / CBS 148.51 / DSM 1962 / NBRC 6347 / NRRL 1970) TaxID=306901 RepID=Q2H855_CHAGB|nr:uncharacterized protein CHGG_03599 [Chaetomium globosum CBS 148.51]EAQ91664.1 predicted protein [Chaetomium globosum CBS 148.51]